MGPKPRASDGRQDVASLRPILIRIARRFGDHSDAEDLVQEALARALERSASLLPNTDFRAWMRPVIRNLAIDEVRKRRRFRPLEEALTAAMPGPARVPVWNELDASDVRRALAGCPHELRTTFELHYWEMLPLDTIADRLGVARATVGTRLFRARAYVRRELERSLYAGPSGRPVEPD
jgi:RNA polymerase sigma-70 factor (ECF subfamily)